MTGSKAYQILHKILAKLLWRVIRINLEYRYAGDTRTAVGCRSGEIRAHLILAGTGREKEIAARNWIYMAESCIPLEYQNKICISTDNLNDINITIPNER